LSRRAIISPPVGIVAMAVIVALAVAPPIRAASTLPLVVAKAPLGQTVQDLLEGRFVEKVSCRRACTMTTSLVISDRTARRLGFKGVVAGRWVQIGTAKARLEAKMLKKVAIRLNAQARLRLPMARADIRVLGRVEAMSTRSPRVSGSAGWFVTCSAA
jgi:hypothetical protein